jgi:hypothetical protein
LCEDDPIVSVQRLRTDEDGPRNMAVVDILRDRERGMVRYNQARRQYGLKPFTKFEELTDNAEARSLILDHIQHATYSMPRWVMYVSVQSKWLQNQELGMRKFLGVDLRNEQSALQIC